MKGKKAKKLLKEAKKLIKKMKKLGKDGETVLAEVRKIVGAPKPASKTKKAAKKNPAKSRSPKAPVPTQEEALMEKIPDTPGNEPQA